MNSGCTIKQWLTVVLIALSSALTVVHAQQVTLDVQPRTLRLNETATLKLTFINTTPPQSPALPDIPGFQISYVGQEQQFQFVNGEQERRLTFNFRLQPTTTGQFRLGPFSLNFAGQNVDFDAMMVEVLPVGAANSTNGATQIDELVFARIELPRTEVYLQERFDVELHLFYRGVQLDRNIQLQNLPSTGINLDEFQEIGSSREAINGELFEVRRFRMRATAMTAGSFQLDPMVRVHVMVPRQRQRDAFFGGFDDVFFGRYEAQPLVVPAEPKQVLVRSLPADGKPDNFSGAVGQFAMDMEVQPREVSAGDPITLTIRITGRGNFETISMPKLDLGDDFRRYDPKLTASAPDQKTFEQVFIPRHERITELPPVSFSYFDPQQGQYQTIVRGPLPLTVKAGSANQLQLVQSPTTQSGPNRAPLGIDIIGPKRLPEQWPVTPTVAATSIPTALHLSPLVMLALGWMVLRRRAAINGDVTRRRRSMAPSSARAALRLAEGALEQGDAAAFHQALWRAFSDYTAHRCNLEAGEVSPALIRELAARGGLAAPHSDALAHVLSACDEARFSRAGTAVDKAALKARLQQTQDLLRAFEKIPFTR